jgi:hypothetical protein
MCYIGFERAPFFGINACINRRIHMGKRSEFVRRKSDAYQTIDYRASWSLVPHLNGIRTFAEPCAGEGRLIEQFTKRGMRCAMACDILDGIDALSLPDYGKVDAIITNPPWTRQLLHPLILHFQRIAPTWLLFDSDWAYNKLAVPYLDQCSDIVAVGRLRWIEGTTQTGKDNVSWYKFDWQHNGGPKFHGRRK